MAPATCLQVFYTDPRPETVFESEELDAEAVTGMWGLAARPADPHHSLVVISFVGGTRALQLEGGCCAALHAAGAVLRVLRMLCCAVVVVI